MKLSFRHYFTVLGTLIALVALFGTAPGVNLINVTFGAEVISKLSSLPAIVFAVLSLWIGSKALFDYIDMQALVDKASENPQGAAMIFIGVNIGRIALALLAMGMISLFS